jgi:hypothetical protein
MSVEGAYVVKMRMVSLLASHRVSLLSTLLLVAVLQFTCSLVYYRRCISEVRRSSTSDVAATFPIDSAWFKARDDWKGWVGRIYTVCVWEGIGEDDG